MNDKRVLGCLLVLFACRAVLASAIVPPWQGPDEPAHFIPAQLLTVRYTDYWDSRAALQRQVLESMGRHRWWEAYGGRTPDPLPATFIDASERLSIGAYSQPMYYGLGALALRVAPAARLEGRYWRLRILSTVLAIGTLALAWAGTRLLMGPAVAAGATAIGALHPQFLLTAISVNPDALAIFWGAVIWLLIACVVTGRRAGLSLILIVVIAATAVLTKRNSIPFAAVTGLIALGLLVRAATGPIRWRITGWTRVLLLAGGLAVVAAAVAFENVGAQLAFFWRSGLTLRRLPDQATLRAALEYAGIGVDYVWFIGGWLRFPAPNAWLWIVRVLTIAGFAGAAVLVARVPEWRRPLLIAWGLVAVQVAVTISWGFWTLSSPQGRYLFPVLAPATALLWLGLTTIGPPRIRPHAAPALVALLAILDVTAFAAALMPNYLPWG